MHASQQPHQGTAARPGIRDVQRLDRSFVKSLAGLRIGDGRRLPERLREEIAREHERLCLVVRRLKELEADSKGEPRAARPGSPEARIMQLIDLKRIGPLGGQKLVNEVFYRDFDNRQVGSYFGLTGTSYDSGERNREQGISKAGNRRARELAVELAWLWTVHQPTAPDALVPRAGARHQGTHPANYHCRPGTQADGGAV